MWSGVTLESRSSDAHLGQVLGSRPDRAPGMTGAAGSVPWGPLAGEDVAGLLRRSGGRATDQKRRVLRRVLDAGRHLTAGELHRRAVESGEPIDLSTVHRVLTSLTDSGVLHCVFTSSGASYGVQRAPHLHSTCRSCGVTCDLDDLGPRDFAWIAARAGTLASASTVVVVTLCPGCQPANVSPEFDEAR